MKETRERETYQACLLGQYGQQGEYYQDDRLVRRAERRGVSSGRTVGHNTGQGGRACGLCCVSDACSAAATMPVVAATMPDSQRDRTRSPPPSACFAPPFSPLARSLTSFTRPRAAPRCAAMHPREGRAMPARCHVAGPPNLDSIQIQSGLCRPQSGLHQSGLQAFNYVSL